MKWPSFRKRTKNKTQLAITRDDRSFVDYNIYWLVQVYGFPNKDSAPIKFDDRSFPKSFNPNGDNAKNLIGDICTILGISSSKIKFATHTDIRDSYDTAYEIVGDTFEMEVERKQDYYIIHLALSNTKVKNQLLYYLLIALMEVKMLEDRLQFNNDGLGEFRVVFASILFGLGPLLSNLINTGGKESSPTNMIRTWKNYSIVPDEMMSYALALYAVVSEQEHSSWSPDLREIIRDQFLLSISFLNENPSTLFDENELRACEKLRVAHEHYLNNQFQSAIECLEEALFLTKDKVSEQLAYNDLGYYQTRLGNFQTAIHHFKKALSIELPFAYALDNLGYSLIQIGDLDEGRKHIDMAMETPGNDFGYSHRNYALYYWKKNDLEKAQNHFDLAYDTQQDSVDLLDYYYGKYLIETGNRAKGIEHLKKAVEKGEPEAIEKMKELENKT